MFRYSLGFTAVLFCASLAEGHAPPIYVPVPPFHVQGRSLVDSTNTTFLLRGVRLPDTTLASAITFRTIQQRWNLNTVRIPISIALWRQDGAAYLQRIHDIVQTANAEHLIVVLACDDGRSALAFDAPAFWSAAAAAFKDSPGVVFSVFNHLSPRTDWRAWQSALQPLADAIRTAGAKQILSFSAFDDALDFQGFGPDFYIRDANTIYEAHPFYDHAKTDAERETNLGGLTVPVYAGEWGMPFGVDSPSCRAIPADVAQQHAILLQTLLWFDTRSISWTLDDFSAGSLVQDFAEYNGTALDRAGTCDPAAPAQPGIGVDLLLWTTGDPGGFGSLVAELMANAAGGPARPPSPGGLMSIYGQGLGPDTPAVGQSDSSGSFPTNLGGTQVFFDGVAAPMLLSSLFQINMQAPFELAGKKQTIVQLFRNGVPSNKLTLPVLDVNPEIFALFGLPSEAAALNQDAKLNTSSNPAARGTIVSLFATGAGIFNPPTPTGLPAQSGSPQAGVTAKIGGQSATIFYAGVAPGLVGLLQVNAQVPPNLPPTQRAEVVIEVAGQPSRSGVTIWIQ